MVVAWVVGWEREKLSVELGRREDAVVVMKFGKRPEMTRAPCDWVEGLKTRWWVAWLDGGGKGGGLRWGGGKRW